MSGTRDHLWEVSVPHSAPLWSCLVASTIRSSEAPALPLNFALPLVLPHSTLSLAYAGSPEHRPHTESPLVHKQGPQNRHHPHLHAEQMGNQGSPNLLQWDIRYLPCPTTLITCGHTDTPKKHTMLFNLCLSLGAQARLGRGNESQGRMEGGATKYKGGPQDSGLLVGWGSPPSTLFEGGFLLSK